ncbi:MAG: RNA 2',3'-cyclic phosphodiesterase [Candidatus Moranbacteria bacterium]|nr:RNA 2',3'-cyclic phosphodiesterase [Candidatus Moranbacteria bacterium]
MKQRKIFLGVSIPKDVSKRLARKMERWQHLPFRFTKEGNMHITLLFLGHVLDESVAKICMQVEEVCRNIHAFDVDLNTITLVPEQGREAKQLWYMGEANEELKQLRMALEQELGMFSVEKKVFRPHVTLGRARQHLWQELSEIPEMKDSLSVFLPVDSVIVYESVFQKGEGLAYEVLAECPLVY